MKKILLFSLLIMGVATHAQDVEFGIEGGANLQNVDIQNFDGHQTYEDIQNGNRKLGYHAGLFMQFKLGALFLQPELTFTHINSNFEAQGISEPNQDVDISFNRLDIPVFVGLGLGPIRLGVGPVLSFNLSEQNDVFNDGLKGGTLGYQLGVGVDLQQFRIDLRYEGALTNTAESVRVGDQVYPTDARTSQFILSLGINFLED